MFRNKLNSKVYIGQSVNLRERLRKHVYHSIKNDLDLPLYRAFNKHGIINFELIILEQFLPTDETTVMLDEKEKFYIKQYDSYNKGYNCTIGGDLGVTGLKMTEQQRYNVSKASRQNAVKYSKPVFIYNVEDKSTIYTISISAASKILNLFRSSISNAANSKYKCIDNKYIMAFTIEELDLKKKEVLKNPEIRNGGKFTKGHSRSSGSRNKSTLSDKHRKNIRQSLERYKVEMKSLDGTETFIFDSPKEASLLTGYNVYSIRNACRKRIKVYKKHVWNYIPKK